jgi:hypothetical protein
MKPFRSKRYTDWVKSLPSVVSGRPADDPHHIKCPGFGGTAKCSDLFTIPLTRDEHDEFHRIGWKSWEEKYAIDQRVAAMRTIELAIDQGVLTLK